jgi:hypothetical protein
VLGTQFALTDSLSTETDWIIQEDSVRTAQ